MKFNSIIFSKPQQDQLKNVIGNELDAAIEKVNDVDARMLNYAGDWVTDNEYHVNDVVTWGTNGHLYEVIKAHTSSASFDPDNPEYYKAMTSSKSKQFSFTAGKNLSAEAVNAVSTAINSGKNATMHLSTDGASFRIPIGIRGTSLTAYAVNIDSDNAVTEYFFSWVQGGNISIIKRTTTDATGTPSTTYSKLSLSTTSPRVSIRIGL